LLKCVLFPNSNHLYLCGLRPAFSAALSGASILEITPRLTSVMASPFSWDDIQFSQPLPQLSIDWEDPEPRHTFFSNTRSLTEGTPIWRRQPARSCVADDPCSNN